MLLCELFLREFSDEEFMTDTPTTAGRMTSQLQQAALDYLTPLLAQNVPFVTIDQMVEALRSREFGIIISRPLIMDLLNPEQIEAVSKIEGDRIYLQSADGDETREVDADDAEKDKERVGD